MIKETDYKLTAFLVVIFTWLMHDKVLGIILLKDLRKT